VGEGVSSRHGTEVSSHFWTLAAFLLGKEPLLPIF